MHQHAGTFGMDGGKRAGTHGADAPQVADKTTVHPLGIDRVGIFHLLGEGVFLKPLHQFQVHGDALVTVLCSMHVQVVHSGNQQPVAEINDFRVATLGSIGSQRCQIGRHPCHSSVSIHSDITIFQHFKMILVFCIEYMGFINFLHFANIILIGELAKIHFFRLCIYGIIPPENS